MSMISAARRQPRILPQKWDGKTVFDAEEVAEIFGVSRWYVYEMIKSGDLGAISIGRLRKVPRHVIEGKLTPA